MRFMTIIQILLSKLPRFPKRVVFYGKLHYCNLCGASIRKLFPFGFPPRPAAWCPVCCSLERDRLAWLVLERKGALREIEGGRCLHFAPEAATAARLRGTKGLDYLSADLMNPRAMEQMDIMNIPYADGSFDLNYCSHVLEHVADDRKALKELHRVLKNDGLALIMVPITE